MKKVIIYVLVDPITLKVRYIGRTRSTLKKRLGEHISKAKHDYNKTHKCNWIKSLLRINSKPYIRKIAEINGWKESHIFERDLINKYKHRLLNHDDRGEGSVNHIVSDEQKLRISNTLKQYFKYNKAKTNTPIHVYNYEGVYIKSYNSIIEASKELKVYHGTISKHLTGVSKIPNRVKLQFSYTKVDKMIDYTNK